MKNKIDGAIGMAKEALKKKVITMIMPYIIAALPYILLVPLVIILIFVPIIYITQNIENVLSAIDKTINFLTLRGWNSSEEAFFETLQYEYDRYQAYKHKEGEFDVAIIAATVHYNTILDPDAYTQDDKKASEEGYVYDDSDHFIPNNQLRDFYVQANNELGHTYTLALGQKGLLGHLIDIKFTNTCAALPSGWDLIKPREWLDVAEEVKDSFVDLLNLTKNVVVDTGKDYIENRNAIKIYQLIYVYNGSGGASYLKTYLSNAGYEVVNDNVLVDFFRIIKQSDLSTKCPSGQIALPVITKFVNYNRYMAYLKGNYLPRQPYNAGVTNTDIFERQAEEIFDQKEAYEFLKKQFAGEGITTYIPGVSSFPIGVTGNWRSNVSRGYQLGTARCYKEGKFTGETNCDHLGVDFAYSTGTSVLAIADGYVIATVQSFAGYGFYVKLGHDVDDDGKYDYYSLYAHLSAINVVEDQMIGGGQQLGRVGSTGNSSGSHLHFEIRDQHDNKINPEPILDGIADGNSMLDNTNP